MAYDKPRKQDGINTFFKQILRNISQYCHNCANIKVICLVFPYIDPYSWEISHQQVSMLVISLIKCEVKSQ